MTNPVRRESWSMPYPSLTSTNCQNHIAMLVRIDQYVSVSNCYCLLLHLWSSMKLSRSIKNRKLMCPHCKVKENLLLLSAHCWEPQYKRQSGVILLLHAHGQTRTYNKH